MHVFADSKIWLLILPFGCFPFFLLIRCRNLVLDQYKELLPDTFEYSGYLFIG